VSARASGKERVENQSVTGDQSLHQFGTTIPMLVRAIRRNGRIPSSAEGYENLYLPLEKRLDLTAA